MATKIETDMKILIVIMLTMEMKDGDDGGDC